MRDRGEGRRHGLQPLRGDALAFRPHEAVGRERLAVPHEVETAGAVERDDDDPPGRLGRRGRRCGDGEEREEGDAEAGGF